MRDIVELITSIPNDRTRVTIFEGYRMQEIAKILHDKMNLDVEKFVSICYDKDFIPAWVVFTLGIRSRILLLRARGSFII